MPVISYREALNQAMLEEMRASDLKNHADVQKRTIDNAVNRAKLLMTTKVGKA